jgi:hypothetical protein
VSWKSVDTVGRSRDVRVPRGHAARSHEGASEPLGARRAHASQLGQHSGQRELRGRIELEQVGDRAPVALRVDEPRRRHAVRAHQGAALGVVQIEHDGHGEHSRRRARS